MEQKGTRHKTWVALLVGLIFSIVALPSCAESPESPGEVEENLLILSHSTYVDSYGYFHLVGEVENVGKRNTEQNRILVSFFSENGTTYATGSGPCYRQIIAPGEKSPFEIVFLTAPQGDEYRLATDCQATDIQPRDGVTFRDVTSSIDSEARYVVTGEIINEGSDTIDDAMIICTCYDTSDRVVAVGLSFADASPIQAAGSSNFTLILDPSVSANIAQLSLQSEVD
jgi:hypothetical protein